MNITTQIIIEWTGFIGGPILIGYGTGSIFVWLGVFILIIALRLGNNDDASAILEDTSSILGKLEKP